MNIWPLQVDCDAFYGNPRGPNGSYDPKWAAANLTHVACPWPLHMGDKTVPFITIHKHCAESLARVLAGVWDALAHDYSKVQAEHYDRYDGSFNFRPMRGGHQLSMHSYGCAIDWDAAENPQHSQGGLFTRNCPLIAKFIEEGWTWGGDWSGSSRDPMHVEAARVR